MYNDAITEYERNGWARRLTNQELSTVRTPVYYLPHHGVYRPEKKSTPLRVVFDPASPYQGVSLNSLLHKGPCLIGNLLGVLLCFREEPIAFRVTFGDKPSPDMASFVMLKMADDNEGENPSAATILRRDRLPKAVDAVVNVTPNEAANAETSINLDGEKGTKTLGVGWNPETDVISFDVKAINIEKLTKRTDVWRAKEYDWDDPLPDDKDASGVAYGAVSYLLWPTPHGPEVRLIAAKARVAPLRQNTIPRLELMAALIASRLASLIYAEFKTKPSSVTLWSDSKIVLHWICSESALLKAFVGELRGRWMNGPPFLKKSKEEWPAETKEEIHVHDDPERKKPKTIGAVNAKASKQNPTEIKSGPLEPEEIKPAEHYWIRQAQADLVDWEDKYKDLAPFIKEEIIRVGGRLKRSQMTYDQTHPILLPAKHHISYLIMQETHNKVAHAGVDLFGPFSLKFGRNKSSKAWGAIFTCATTRAVHLEIVESSSSESFVQALRRFASHHGWPSTVISDNGKSFVGAEAELRKLVVEGRKQINDFAVLHKIRWIFTTPLSPHQGGIYESLIKQTKKALRVTVGNQVLSWNEMSTVFAEVKSLVNSRPLGHASNDPNDPQPLTPNHFILGRASADIPQGPFQESKNLRKRFQFVQTLTHHFWKRFIREYLPTLMRRVKWQTKQRQVIVGDLVLLVDYNAPRGKWNMARVKETYPEVLRAAPGCAGRPVVQNSDGIGWHRCAPISTNVRLVSMLVMLMHDVPILLVPILVSVTLVTMVMVVHAYLRYRDRLRYRASIRRWLKFVSISWCVQWIQSPSNDHQFVKPALHQIYYGSLDNCKWIFCKISRSMAQKNHVNRPFVRRKETLVSKYKCQGKTYPAPFVEVFEDPTSLPNVLHILLPNFLKY
ncbi:hypothetical protein QZH41_003507 [Actinostola sp. cb2023]|nr:hypothetical protein QZH41_003507 [Actinostola sp. cb2023]